MVCRILHERGGISSRFLAWVLLCLTTVLTPATASPLFTDDSVLEIRLSGPLNTIARNRQDSDRTEYPFVLGVNGAEIPLDVRVRGNSRTSVCSFPPLRLDFPRDATGGTVFEQQNKLKLVTHCRSNSKKFENNVLDEYAAYRIFNLVSDLGYRVRLLRILYEDTDGRLRNLERPYYGFVIESDQSLAERTGATVAKLGGVPYGRLNDLQAARLSVFQYLVGNTDWSIDAAENSQTCSHNVHLIEKNDELFPIPYDFDLAGIVNASYARPDASLGIRRVTQRIFRGYCKTPLKSVRKALDDITDLRDPIMSVVASLPASGKEESADRLRFIEDFYRKDASDTEKLLRQFDDDCVGPG